MPINPKKGVWRLLSGGIREPTLITLRRPSNTSLSIRLLSSFFVPADVPCFPSFGIIRPEAEADWAASKVKSLAVSRIDEIRESDSMFPRWVVGSAAGSLFDVWMSPGLGLINL